MGLQDDLIQAIKSGELERVRDFINEDPDLLKTRDSSGISIVLLALYYGKKEIVDEILIHEVPLDIFDCAALGKVEHLQELIKVDQSRVNSYSGDGFTPLGLAAFFGQIENLKLLVDQGADVNAESKNQMQVRPIHSAVAHRQVQVAYEMAEYLLANGAVVNVAQHGGWTPLHQAAAHGQEDMVKLLLRYYADVSARSEDGRTPAELAAEAGYDGVISILSAEWDKNN